MCGRASMTICSAQSRSLKSGTSTSMMIDGFAARTASMVCLKCSAPPSRRSSRATAVITTWRKFRRWVASATRCGSSASSASGRAVLTAQKPQARVHFSPAIMKVAVPWLQHSQRFGHWASSQTVTNLRSVIRDLVDQKTGLLGRRTLIHEGFLSRCNTGSILIFGPQLLIAAESRGEGGLGKVESGGGVLDRSCCGLFFLV